MSVVQILPIFAAAGFAVTAGSIAMRPETQRWQNIWMFPALLSLAFFAWSLFAVLTEGPMGFWVEHTRNLWGNQIWFDLLLSIGIGWALIAPRAKAQAMSIWLWLAFILATGSIGFLAMFTRLLFLEQRNHKQSMT
jgi:hypothetical protein